MPASRSSRPRPRRPRPRRPRSHPRRRRLLATLPCLLAVAAGCGDADPPALAAGGIEWTEDELLGLSPERREALGVLAGFGQAVAAGEVDALGEPLVERRRREALARLLVAERTLDSAGVGDDVLRARYRTNPELELTVRHLIVLSERWESDAARAEARAKAERALERIRAGEPFPRVAAEVSEEPGAEGREGLLEPGRQGAWVDEFWNSAVSLEPGEISGVVETQYGFHVQRLEARDTVPFREARPSVVQEVAAMVDPGYARTAARPGPPADLELAEGALERVADPAAPDSTVLASWDGRRYALGEHRRHLATLPADGWARATSGEPGERREALVDAAALAAAAVRAADAGLPVPAGEEAAARREWRETADRWAATLGFAEGMAGEAVKEAAREAVAATGQGATLAREEIARRAPLVRFAVPVRVESQGASGP